ncbi:MAG: DNA topoisomerase I [Candidatus Rokubacteria bacterium GWC2_70_24]|nr:MAG: DNA topoisomerase I [Candidatus Rokubacteria bacterium GWA2_70_23]OGK87347.1 MAG: DNA topoisomerase I [Candidatus Rokubacteria bacterium GWC2_70_24]
MAKRALVVVESPTKVKTIQKYLDSKYIVKASMGHIRDLPKSKLGVDEKKGFKPDYKVLPAKKKVLDELKKAAEKVDALYIATDPDREGEAIGWHLAAELGISKSKTYRIMFNEITERAVKAAFQRPGKIDMNKVNAQQARRILDRLVGYKLSPLLWEKIRRGLSAGRVQSVAVRLLTEREREIQAFVAVEYWSLHARLLGTHPPEFTATLREVRGEKASLPSERETVAVMTALHGCEWRVTSVTRGERKRNPAAPFTTSTLQQEAGRKLHFTAKKTMMLAQQLYEGIELGAEGSVGLITYMRTDAVRVSQEAQAEARDWVGRRLGREYLPDAPPVYRARKSAQEAHEAIRPAFVEQEPKAVARFLSRDQLALYRLIWERFLASQMLPAVYDTVAADIRANDCLFRAQGSTLKFQGFMAVYVESREEVPETQEDEVETEAVVPPLVEGERLRLRALDPKQHFTQPPPRYTEASLVKTLEERGIGRPSTYAQILSTIQEREYARREKGTLFPTELGMLVTDSLVPHFPEVMDVEFTAGLEESLDKIEEGEADWVETVAAFYTQFSKDLARAGKKMDDVKKGTETGDACPDCGKPIVEKWGRFGKFLACSAYPECTYTKDLGGGRVKVADEPTEEICPTCSKPMVIKHGRFGKFIACSGYPACKTTKPVPLGIGCPQPACGGQLVERRTRKGRTFYACTNYPQCTFSVWTRPIPEPCPKCAAPFLTERIARGGRTTRACVRDECGYKQEVGPAVA